MSGITLLKRYVIFILSLFIMAVGVVLSVKADLGVSPISSVPYVLSLAFPLTMGQITILMHVIFVILQVLLLGRKFKTIQLMQVLMAIPFGCFIDIAFHLLSWINTTHSSYVMQIFYLVVSCVIVAMGMSMEVVSDVVMLAGEGLANTIARVTKVEFGQVKIPFDVALVVLSIIFSITYLGYLKGIREGTIIAAFLVGAITRLFVPRMQTLMKVLISH